MSILRSVILTTTFLLGSICLHMPAQAQPLADQVPHNTLVYVGWSGFDAQQQAYDQSHLKALIDEVGLTALRKELADATGGARDLQPQAIRQTTEMWIHIGDVLKRYPTAFYFAGLHRDENGIILPIAGFVSKVGDDAAQVKESLNFIHEARERLHLPMDIIDEGDGTIRVNMGAAGTTDSSLAGNANFKQMLTHAQPNPAMWVYVNINGAIQLIEKSDDVAPSLVKPFVGPWNHLKKQTGIAGMRQFIWSAGFEGQDWASTVFIDAPSPRSGWLERMNMQPLSDTFLNALPADAAVSSAVQFDAKMFAQPALHLAKIVDSRTVELIEMQLKLLKTTTGMELEKRIIESLGTQWALSGHVDGSRTLIVHELSDAKQFVDSINIAMPAINATLNQRMEELNLSILNIQFNPIMVNGTVVWRLGLPFMAPAFAVRGDTLLLGSADQIMAHVQAGAGEAPAGLLSNQAFAQLRKSMGAQKAGTFWYIDLPKAAAQAGALSPTAYATAEKALKHMGPAGAFAWTDEAGWHLKSRTPFPGAIALAHPPLRLLTEPATLLGTILPIIAPPNP